MKLLTKADRKKLPPVGHGGTLADPYGALAIVKFFSPYSNWTWYASEFDGKDTFFGVVVGFEREYGYFSLSELQAARVFGSVPAVERDRFWEPKPLRDCK